MVAYAYGKAAAAKAPRHDLDLSIGRGSDQRIDVSRRAPGQKGRNGDPPASHAASFGRLGISENIVQYNPYLKTSKADKVTIMMSTSGMPVRV
ncbi:hypothetical protein GCM10009102_30060 [Sphingomonas insulae]|uniref:Uncharacterized protein n=1 Tax=Sphingomonas insulae TaxID=424800 RepID=A0ABP3T5S6_9SPHN